MQNNDPDREPVDPAVLARRELLTFWAFTAFLLAGILALGVDALVSYT